MRWRVLLLVGLALALTSSSHAQAVGSCETGNAQRVLENDQLRATLFNTGGLFFGGSTTSGDGYILPKRSSGYWGYGPSPLFAVSFWLGGRVDAELRVAAARYGSWDFWPGPLEDAESPPVACFHHDRIYVVSRADIRRYHETGELTDDLRDWPYRLGASVIDGDGNPDNYDLRAGDQPDLIGDTAAWWVMNDAGNEHGVSSPNGALGVEVRVQAFVYGQTTATSSPVLSQTSFYRYEIINRRRQPIEDLYGVMWMDADLGDAGDDYIGTDTLRHMLIFYNDSNEDAVYGSPPPAIAMQVLQGPIGLVNGRDDDFDGEVDEPGERLRASSTGPVINAGPDGTDDPGRLEEYYNRMQGYWSNGTPFYEYGTGFEQAASGAPTTRFPLSGDPVTESYWSEVNVDGSGTNAPQGQRRGLIATGPFRLNPGARTTFLYAIPFGQGSSNLQSVEVLQWRAEVLQRLAEDGFFASRPVEDTRARPTHGLALSRAHPNPARQPEVVLTLPEAARVRATVIDVLGRQLEVVVDGELPEGDHELAMPAGLAPGTYLLRVEVPGAVETVPFTVVR